MEQYFIKSPYGWYLDNSEGYTEYVVFAGLFDEEEALSIEQDSDGSVKAIKASDVPERTGSKDKYTVLANRVKRNLQAMGF